MSDGYFGEEVAATYDEASADMFDAAIYDCATQALSSNYVAEVGRRSIPFRYV